MGFCQCLPDRGMPQTERFAGKQFGHSLLSVESVRSTDCNVDETAGTDEALADSFDFEPRLDLIGTELSYS